MGWLDKLFGTEDTTEPEGSVSEELATPFSSIQGIRFGRYSDNNKSNAKTKSWYLADDYFKAKEYSKSFAAFFDYITDEAEQNVVFKADRSTFDFEIIQGSKKIIGHCDGNQITAKASIAKMDQPSNAVMRRLLELNNSIYYSHTALDDNQILCLLFKLPIETASPPKLFFALREICLHADRQDDLLVSDFTSLSPVDIDHIRPLPAAEIDVKYTYFRNWIQETLDRVNSLNADSFSGASSYLYLTLLSRIDFLIVPQAKLEADLEAINFMFWNRKDEIPVMERNTMLKEGITKLLEITHEQFAKGLYRSNATFSTTAVTSSEILRENVMNSLADSDWFVENKYPDIALVIYEYGLLYNQYSYSLPKLITDLNLVLMAVIHSDYFQALGMNPTFILNNAPDKIRITSAIEAALNIWAEKFESLTWDNEIINYSSISEFAKTYSIQVVNLNLEAKRFLE